MPATEEYAVELADIAPKVRSLLARADVRRVTVMTAEGEPILQVPGTEDPDTGARQVLASFDEPAGASGTVRLVAETSGLRRTPAGIEGLDTLADEDLDREEPLEDPEAGEPYPHG